MPLTGYFEPAGLTSTDIQNACNSAKSAGGGTVWLGNGTYTCNTTITFDPSCVSIEGADAILDCSARTGSFQALIADATGSFNYKRGLAHALRGFILRGNNAAGSVGLYLDTPLGAHDNSTTLNCENFVIDRFGVNLDIGANCYICTFRGISLGWCVSNQIRRLSFQNNGENMSFFGGQIFNGSGIALNLRSSNQEWRFFGTSFDYNKQILYTDAPSVEFHGCHFEASAANLTSLLNWQGVFEGDNGARVKFFGGEIGLTNTQLTNIDHFFKSWGTGGFAVEFHGTELPSSLHYKLGLCNDMSRIITYPKRANPAKSLTIDSKKIVYSDFKDANNFKLLATSDFYLPNPTNYVDGQEGSYWIKQDSVGNRKLLMIGDKFFGEPITLSTQPNYEDRIDYKVTDDNIEYTFQKRTSTMIAGSLNPIMLGQIASSDALLLDAYPNALVAYSLQKLRSDYTGACIKVRRSSDNAELDIGFSGNSLNEADLLSFVGAGDGFVSVQYDQSTNGFNSTQVTLNRQPIIVLSGVVIKSGSKPIMRTQAIETGGLNVDLSVFNSITEATGFSVFKQITGNGGWARIGDPNAGQDSHTPWLDGNCYDNFLGSGRVSFSSYGAATAPSTINLTLHTSKKTTTTQAVYKNNNQVSSTFSISSAAPLIAIYPNLYDNNVVIETDGIILYPSALSDVDRIGIGNKLISLFGIT